VDQVVRLEQFRGGHPEWHIWCSNHVWHAERTIETGSDKVIRYGLKFLLDDLESRS